MLQDNLIKLSQLSMETTGASFYIQHYQSGKFKVVFNNTSAYKPHLKPTDINTAITDAITWLEGYRRENAHVLAKYTVYPSI